MKNYLNTLARWHLNIREVENKIHRILWAIGLLICIIGISGVNFYSEQKYINSFPLNIVPVMLASWLLGLRVGVVFALLSSVLAFIGMSLIHPEPPLLIRVLIALARIFTLCFFSYGVWKIQNLIQQLATMGLIDPLTEINNRRGFFLKGQLSLELMRRTKQPVSVVFLDVDNFKEVNDTKGHNYGDTVLRHIAHQMQSRLRKVDTLARIGGDEFAIILPITDSYGALKLVNELHCDIQAFFTESNLPITLSIGIATFMQAPESLDYALNCADKVMYEIKNTSKSASLQRFF